jgi:hypothetical protein
VAVNCLSEFSRIAKLGRIFAANPERTLMAKKSKLTQAAVTIGSVMGKADRTAHKVAKAGVLAKKELEEIGKQVETLRRQLQKTTQRLKKALS